MSTGYFQNVGSFIRDCNGTTLRHDRACLQIFTNEPVSFLSQYEECEGCDLLETAYLTNTKAIVLKTLSPVRYVIRNSTGEICNGTYQFEEFGQYNISLPPHAGCQPRMTAEPDAAYLPILTAAVVLLSMATLWYIVKGIVKRLQAGSWYARHIAREDNELGSETRVLTAETSVPRSPTRSRLRSLDIFRGIAIALMIFVNAGGGGYDIFSHSVWNGITLADMVFPWFAFAMGEALVLSLNARLRTAMPRTTAFWQLMLSKDLVEDVVQANLEVLTPKDSCWNTPLDVWRQMFYLGVVASQVVRRAVVMSFLGILVGSVNSTWWSVRTPGVLQRLAAMYLIVAALECAFMRTNQDIQPGRSYLRDISAGWQQWLATLLLVAIQVCITLLVPAPHCPRGYMGPGGKHLSAFGEKLDNCTGGIAGYIDRLILGPNHLHQRGTFTELYRTTLPHDPEGILGILSGVLVVQAGAHATRIMLVYNHARARIMRWVFWSIMFGAAGGALCMFSKNGGPIPLNKNLWSVSYCLVCASTALFAQAVLYFIVDLKNKWGGRPLYYAGQNAIFLYVGSELLRHHFPLYWNFAAPTHNQLLATNSATMLLWLAVGIGLYRKRIFITI